MAGSEWLESDGLGGFASGPVLGPRTRRYHALLLTATTPPTGRIVLVNGFEAMSKPARLRYRSARSTTFPTCCIRTGRSISSAFPRTLGRRRLSRSETISSLTKRFLSHATPAKPSSSGRSKIVRRDIGFHCVCSCRGATIIRSIGRTTGSTFTLRFKAETSHGSPIPACLR